MKKKFLSFVIVASNLICCACNFNIVSANDNIRDAYANILKTYVSKRDTYCIYDIDKNDIPELIIRSGGAEANYCYHYYTFSNGIAKKITDRSGTHVELYSNPSGEGILEYWLHQGGSAVTLVTLNNGTLSEQRLAENNYGEPSFGINEICPGCMVLDDKYDEYYTSYGYYKNNHVGDLSHLNEWFSNNTNSIAITYGSIYENITTERLQIQSYISKKMYLEAISLCNKVLNTRKISDADIDLLNEYKNAAQTAYKAYVDDLNKNKTTQYYISDWCMGYKFFDMYKPIYDTNYVNVFSDSYTGDYIWVYSYEIGTPLGYLYNETIKSPKQYVSGFARYYKENFHDCDGNESDVEILSENDTTVGNFPARQVTLRTSIDLNRYGTSKYYTIVRCTAFQYGKWVYVIVANKNSYSWGDDFWNKMELVRNSISFY